MILRQSLSRAFLVFAGIIILSSVARAGDEDWRPVDPAHLAMKAPLVEKDADAEAIFWDVSVDDGMADLQSRSVRSHYIRIKIFSERGIESQSKIDLPYLTGSEIRDIAARTIKPDGSIVELKKDAIFDRTLVKGSGLKLKAKSFALPGVEPGSIIEYRWRELHRDTTSFYVRLQLQREIPVQVVRYLIKPMRSLPGFKMTVNVQTFQRDDIQFKEEKNGFYSATVANVPAFREEPRMPPEDETRAWMLFYYLPGEKLPPESFWPRIGKRMFEDSKSLIKANDEIKKAAAQIVGDAATSHQKLERLYRFCREQIKNLYDDALEMTAADREKVKENKSPSDTLKRGVGTGFEINLLFASLATAAGFDARIAGLSNRAESFFNPKLAIGYFLRGISIAVLVDGKWELFDPSQRYVPFGMLLWQAEGTQALVADPKESLFVLTPLAPPEKSLEKRSAALRLSEDGTIEGDVRIEYTGHLGVSKKEFNDEDSPEQREQTLRDTLKERMSAAEVSNIRIENATDRDKPFTYVYHVRVPGYAQRTGKRLFLQPGFFQRGISSLFSAGERKYSIYFHYPWSEEDSVTIELPDGFTLESPDAPPSIQVPGVGLYKIVIGASQKKIEYRRSFRFCEGGVLLFPPNSYPQLKKVFDMIHERDNHTLTLRQAGS